MSIYKETTPYFYIIRNKETGIMYAGSKWENGCDPETFMTPKGYQTSSKIVQTIIKKYGLDIFEILRIDTFCDNIHVFQYETLFLKTNDCANSSEWYNQQNSGCFSRESKAKAKITFLTRYGVDHNFKIPEVKEKRKNNWLKKYGVENVSQLESIKEKIKQTHISNHGVINPSQIPFFTLLKNNKTYSKAHLSKYFPEFKSLY